MTDNFKAMVLEQSDGKTVWRIGQLQQNDLPEGDVTVRVDYSSLNFKDSLAVTGTGKIVRTWPMVPGIDFSGTVLESESDRYKPGDAVVLTGWSVGEKYWGGYSQVQRVRSEWLVPLPEQISAKRSMAIGTAGLTSMLCVLALEEAGIQVKDSKILVTGAGGGVGSVAVALLSRLGYTVTALVAEKQASLTDYLKGLGASEVIHGGEWLQAPRALEAQRWTAAIDTVGSNVLARVLAEIDYGGAVAACGLAGGSDLSTTVMPFILRGVRLLGVDSVMCPVPRRIAAWKRLAQDLPEEVLGTIAQEISLEQVPEFAERMLSGGLRGRVIVNPNL